MVLENSKTGEILTQIDFSNKIDPNTSSVAFSLKRVDIKIKKETEDVNWRTLEAQDEASANTAIPAQVTSGAKPSYPTSSKKKRDWNALDKEIEQELAQDKPEGD